MDLNRCSKCDGTCKPVPAYGPYPAQFLLIGEAPGRWEDNTGKPFQGDAGKELDNTYLPRAGIDRSEVRVTNTVLCRPDQNKKPSDGLISACSQFHIPQDIRDCQPDVIVLMGSTACSMLPSINLEIEHGRPFVPDAESTKGTVFEEWNISHGGWIIPMYHPAAGLHSTKLIQDMCEDWEYIGRWRKDTTGSMHPPQPRRHYYLNSRLLPLISIDGIAIDLESVDGKTWSIQICTYPGKVWMYTVDYLVADYIDRLERSVLTFLQRLSHVRTYLHNAPGDKQLLAQLGMNQLEVVDTMQKAYHRQNLPQGLKALGYRLFGVRMMEYTTLVMPYSKQALESWMSNALILCENDLRWVELKQLKTKIKEIQHVSQQEKDLRRILGHSLTKDTYDPWARLEDIHQSLSPLIDSLGPYPTPSIEHVPTRLAVDYACQDADITLQLANWLDVHCYDGMEIDSGDIDHGSDRDGK